MFCLFRKKFFYVLYVPSAFGFKNVNSNIGVMEIIPNRETSIKIIYTPKYYSYWFGIESILLKK